MDRVYGKRWMYMMVGSACVLLARSRREVKGVCGFVRGFYPRKESELLGECIRYRRLVDFLMERYARLEREKERLVSKKNRV